MARRLALLAAGVLVAAFIVLAAFGAYSLITGRSPRILLTKSPSAFRIHFDQERDEAAARNPGEYQVSVDPRIRYTLRRNSEVATVNATARTTELGIRARSGPPPAESHRTIVVLGDSVAFGTGVTDEECIAQRLEDELAAARGDDGARDVICTTAAVPGWNWRNAIGFLESRFDRLRPFVVLYMPIDNDLADTDDVFETGHRRVGLDADQSDPLTFINLGRTQRQLMYCWSEVQAGRMSLSEEEIGPLVLNADLGGESTRRYDDMAAGIVDLSQYLQGRGVRFAQLQYVEGGIARALAPRLARLAPELVWIPLLDQVTHADQLPTDPHPNAGATAAIARWIAKDLVEELRWVEGSVSPNLPRDYEGRRAGRRSAPERQRAAEDERARQRRLLRDVIAPLHGQGVQQVYGGLSPLGTVGPRLLAALPRKRGFLEVELAAIPGRADLYPLRVGVEVDGVELGQIVIPVAPAAGAGRGRFALGFPAVDGGDGAIADTIDVELLPESYGVIEELGGQELASCRLVRLARVDE